MISAIAFLLLIGAGIAAYGRWSLHAASEWDLSLWWFVAAAPLVYMLVPAIFAGAYFALTELFGVQRPAHVRLGAGARVRLFWNETVSLALSAPMMIMYRVLMRDPAPRPATLPVILVHGVLCNAGVWARFRRRLRKRYEGPVYALTYGPPLLSIETFARQLAHTIDTALAATGACDVVLVGHSMGGLVARTYIRRFGGARVRRLITLGTPHHGSMHAWFFPGACLGQMRPGCRWLAELNRDTVGADGVPIVSLWSWHDSMVAPQTSCRLEWAENIPVVGVGHNALLGDPGVVAYVVTEIERARHDTRRQQGIVATASQGAAAPAMGPA